ncbi:hypothetical protein [Streptomyces coeruleorubidus]|uniref:hypothetical protein n=1 Tax=Streptomyces coeruleorubidus TaxID=116188 RepID=UPI0033BB2B76
MSANRKASVLFMAFAALIALAVACGTGWIVAMKHDSSDPLPSLAAGGTAFCLIFFGSAGWAAVLKPADNHGQSQPPPPAAGQAPANAPGTPAP